MVSKPPIKNEVEKQLSVFKEGAVDLISEGELAAKIEKSIVTKKPLRIKYGVDPSASDIHLGHTVPLFKLKALQDLGHQVLFLIGDFTARIGDPSEQSETRKMLSKKDITKHAKTYAQQVFKILDKKKTKIVYNSEWLDPLRSEDFLKLMTHTTVHRMVERDDFKKRFEAKQPISLVEFLYPLLQAYDSVEIKADVELGGTDQKFNLLMGRDFQRSYSQEPQVVITLPILEGTDGVQKMSKSLGNAIGINLPPAEMFGRIMSLPDSLLLPFFQYTTGLSSEAFQDIKRRLDSEENPRHLKSELGRLLVAFYMDEAKARQASEKFDKQFRDKQVPEKIGETLLQKDYPREVNILELSREAAPELGLSGSDIRRLLKQGAVKVNGAKVRDVKQTFDTSQDLTVQYGKRLFRRYRTKARA